MKLSAAILILVQRTSSEYIFLAVDQIVLQIECTISQTETDSRNQTKLDILYQLIGNMTRLITSSLQS